MQIKGKAEGRVDCKRFYLPGITVSDDCPNCGKTVINDMDNEYFAYPRIGKPIPLHFWCGCDEEWDVMVTLEVALKTGEAS